MARLKTICTAVSSCDPAPSFVVVSRLVSVLVVLVMLVWVLVLLVLVVPVFASRD